jgi:hypothetical protein
MTASYEDNPKITKFTTTYLESTGWYKIDKDYIRRTNWGFRRGCGFFGTDPSTYCLSSHPEYSGALDSPSCSFDYLTKGKVQIAANKEYMENCKIIKPAAKVGNDSVSCVSADRVFAVDQSNAFLQEGFGPESRCFMADYSHKNVKTDAGSVYQPVCQRAKVRGFLIFFSVVGMKGSMSLGFTSRISLLFVRKTGAM